MSKSPILLRNIKHSSFNWNPNWLVIRFYGFSNRSFCQKELCNESKRNLSGKNNLNDRKIHWLQGMYEVSIWMLLWAIRAYRRYIVSDCCCSLSLSSIYFLHFMHFNWLCSKCLFETFHQMSSLVFLSFGETILDFCPKANIHLCMSTNLI